MMRRCCVVLLLVFISAAGANAEDDIPLLSVRGVSELKVPADQVEIDLSIVSEAKTAESALEDNAKSIQEVMSALKSLGLEKDEYRSGQFRIQPVWSSRPRNPPADRGAEIVGFTVTSPLHIKSKKKELAGKLIGAVVDAGVNQINAVRFSLSDPRSYREDAIDLAAENAIEDARTLARATGVKLIEVQRLTIDDAAVTPIHVSRDQFRAESAVLAKSSVSVPFNPGDATVSARVSISYRIKTIDIQ